LVETLWKRWVGIVLGWWVECSCRTVRNARRARFMRATGSRPDAGSELDGAKIRKRLGETPRPTSLRKSLLGRANRPGEPCAGFVTLGLVFASFRPELASGP